jgi:hypothetical protein
MPNSGSQASGVPMSGSARHRGNGADVDFYVFGPDAAPAMPACRRHDRSGY